MTNPTLRAVSLACCAPLFCVAACSQPAETEQQARSGATETPASAPISAASSPAPSGNQPGQAPSLADSHADKVNDGYPDLTPVPSKPDVARTETGARAVLLPFARAIELREYNQAWDMMGEHGHQEWSKARWNKMFDGLGRISVSIPGGRMEGAAGSSYYTSPATITATDQQGRPVAIEGPIILRRVNDVPGATPEQLQWHVYSADLKWTH